MKYAFDYAASIRSQRWRTVLGPAGAVVSTLQRLEWSFLSWDVWATADGIVVKVTEVGPRTVQALVEEATTRLL